MRIHLDQLREGPLEMPVDLSRETLNAELEENLELEPATGQATFRLVGQEVICTGTLESRVSGRCGRCLASVSQLLRVPFHLFYWPKDADHEASNLEDLDPLEPDCIFYEGETIEPDEDFRELVLVAAPDLILCREDCPGLCPGCGANLNTEACRCEPEEIEEPAAPESGWKAQLRNIKLEE